MERIAGNDPAASTLAKLRSSTELHPHIGGLWPELNRLPHRDAIYSRAIAPAILTFTTRSVSLTGRVLVAKHMPLSLGAGNSRNRKDEHEGENNTHERFLQLRT